MILGPGLEEGDKARSFDETIACQSTKLDLSGLMHSNTTTHARTFIEKKNLHLHDICIGSTP